MCSDRERLTTPSGDARVFERELKTGLYGRIFLREDPMRIEINSKVNLTRATISLIHELLHMGEELLKDPLPHLALHHMSVALFSNAREMFVGEQPTGLRARDIVADAMRFAGIQPTPDRVRTWTDFILKEVAPTVRKYRRIRESHR